MRIFSRLFSTIAAAAAAVLLVAPVPSLAAAFGSNLIVNGDAEAGPGSDGDTAVAIPGWTVNGKLLAVSFDHQSQSLLPRSALPAGNFGDNFFVGGVLNAYSSITQNISLAPYSASIASGDDQFHLSGWFGGYRFNIDNAALTATFKDSGGNVLTTMTVGGVTPADRSGLTTLQYRDGVGLIPVGAASVDMLLAMSGIDNTYNNGYADNLAFQISAVPENSSLIMLLVGVLVIGGLHTRRLRQVSSPG